MVVKPEAIRIRSRWRIDQFLSHLFDVPLEGFEVILEDAESQVAQPLPLGLGDGPPRVGAAVSIEDQIVALLANIEPER